MFKTGEICTESGYYKCNVHVKNLIYLEKGSKYPDCPLGPYGSHNTLWAPARTVSKILSELKASEKNMATSSE
ncbi:MAG: hypothetical protein JXA72_10300 [Bacteroidales bacterium]|nr:hypothetical protein [Bacteroidales bacterium]